MEERRRTEDRREPGAGDDTGVVDGNPDVGEVVEVGELMLSFALFVSLLVSPTLDAAPVGKTSDDGISSLSLLSTILAPKHVQTAARRSRTSTYFLCKVSSSKLFK
jgi:hypothetical protein